MAVNFQDVTIKNNSGGIDSYSGKSNVKDGYAKDVVNFDTNASGLLTKRKGFEYYYGDLPIRMVSVEHVEGTPDKLRFVLAPGSDINLLNAVPGPIIVNGITDVAANGTDIVSSQVNTRYYPTYTVPTAQELSIGANTLDWDADTHGIDNKYIFTGLAVRSNVVDTSNVLAPPSEVRVDEVSFDIEVDYTASVVETAFVFTNDHSGSYRVNDNGATVLITAGSHGIGHRRIGVKCFESDGINFVEVIPDEVTVDSSTFNVIVEFSGALGSGTRTIILDEIPVTRQQIESLSVGTNTFTISNPGSEVNFVYAYFLDSVSGDYKSALVNSVAYDASADEMTVEYVISGSAETAYIYWENSQILANTIEVEAINSFVGDQAAISGDMYVYGIGHTFYTTTGADKSVVDHIDTYRTPGISEVVTSLQAALLKSTPYSDGNSDLLPTSDIDREFSIEGEVAPIFQPTGASYGGALVIEDAAVTSDNEGVITEIAASSVGSDYIKVVIGLSANYSGTINNILAIGMEIDITGLPYAKMNGTHKIYSWSAYGTVLEIHFRLGADFSRFHSSGLDGRAKINCSRITVGTDVNVGESIYLEASGRTYRVTSTQTASGYISLGDVDEYANITEGNIYKLTGEAYVLQPDSADNFVSGDTVNVLGTDYKTKITSVNTKADANATVFQYDATQLRVRIDQPSILDTTTLVVGTYLRIVYNDNDLEPSLPLTHKINSILTSSEFLVDGVLVEYNSMSAEIKGGTISLDRPITLQTTPNVVTVEGRFTPVRNFYGSTPDSYTDRRNDAPFEDTDNQPIRSGMINDGLFLTDHTNPVRKYDSGKWMPVGLPSHYFKATSMVDASGTGALGDFSAATYKKPVVAEVGYGFSVAPEDAEIFEPGMRISTNSGEVYTVSEVKDLVTPNIVGVSEDTSGSPAPTHIYPVQTFNYYLRLAYVDLNDNVVLGPATDFSGDLRFELHTESDIAFRVVGGNVGGAYDWEHIYLYVYRSNEYSGDLVPRFVRSAQFDSSGTAVFTDNTIDIAVTEIDSVMSNLVIQKGQQGIEAITDLSGPLKSKYVTTTSNRLITANCKSKPTIRVERPRDTTITDNGREFTITKYDNGGLQTGILKLENTLTSHTIVSVAGNVLTLNSVTDLQVGGYIYLTYSAVDPIFSGEGELGGLYRISAINTLDVTVEGEGDFSTFNGSNGLAWYVTGKSDSVPTPPATYVANPSKWATQTSADSLHMQVLATVINSAMTYRDVGVTTDSRSTPEYWVSAKAGPDFGAGVMILEGSDENYGTFTLTTSDFSMFYNDRLRNGSTETINPAVNLYPSRVLRSFSNYVEQFAGVTDTQEFGYSVIDINASDGQEITGIITFFGESTFGAAQLSDAVVVFKENSIYLLDANTKEYLKVDSRGLGCTAPYSIASTKQGIIFANNSGIYRLNRDMSISYVGKYLERKWRDEVNRDDLTKLTATQYGVGRQYKLSYPSPGSTQNDRVFVYSHDQEGINGMEYGSWVEYDNHPATGWANLGEEAFFSTSSGKICRIRNEGTQYDYRDEAERISSTFETAGTDFGVPNTRKIVSGVTSELQLDRTNVSNLAISVSLDLLDSYEDAGDATISRTTTPYATIQFSLPKRRCINISTKVEHATADEDVVLVGLTYRVGALSKDGIPQSADY